MLAFTMTSVATCIESAFERPVERGCRICNQQIPKSIQLVPYSVEIFRY